MPSYIMLFRGGDDHRESLSPDEIQQQMQKWFDWIAAMRGKGIFNGGSPLEDGGVIVNPDRTVTDGPFTESKERIGGYIEIDVENEEAAVEEAKNCPILNTGGWVEVRLTAEINQPE